MKLETVNTEIKITARAEGNGLFISLSTSGDFSSAGIDRRFYSVPELPPDDLPPEDFWAPVLAEISRFLASE